MNEFYDPLKKSLERLNRPASQFQIEPAQIQEMLAGVRVAQYYGCWSAYCQCGQIIAQNFTRTENEGPPVGCNRRQRLYGDQVMSWYFWKFVHNTLIHPLLGFPYEPKWLQRLHDWTAKKCPGGG